MHKKWFLTLLLLAVSIAKMAAEEAISNLVIHLKDGTNMTCLLSDKPTIKFTLSDLIVNSEKASFSVPLDNLARFGFEKQSSAIEIVRTANTDYTIDNNRIILKGLGAEDCIRLYKVDGVCVFERINSTGNETMEIAIDAFPTGIYLLNINSSTSKIAIK